MPRLPLLVALAAAVVFTAVYTVYYPFPPTETAVNATLYYYGSDYFTLQVNYTPTQPPPVLIVRVEGAAIDKWTTTPQSALGAFYVSHKLNDTVLVYKLAWPPAASGLRYDTLYVTVSTRGRWSAVYVSTDNKTWTLPPPRGGGGGYAQ